MAERPASEAELVGIFVSHAKTYFGTATAPARPAVEVRSHGRASIDACLHSDGLLIGFEAKLADWKRAIAQAYLNTYCVDQSYVVMWHDRMTRALVSEAVAYGVGVLAVHPDRIEVMEAAQSGSPRPELRSALVARIRQVEELT